MGKDERSGADHLEALLRREFAPTVRALPLRAGDPWHRRTQRRMPWSRPIRHWSRVSTLANPGAWVFISGVTGSTLNWVAESIEEGNHGLGKGGAHEPIDESNDYWVAIRSVHKQLNDAFGYDRWEREELDGAASKLHDLPDADPEFQNDVRPAAQLIGAAKAESDRDAAVGAHRLMKHIERGLRRR